MLVTLLASLFKILFFPFKLLFKIAINKAIKNAKLADSVPKIIHRVDEPKGRKIAMTLEVPRESELDFLHYRSETYIRPMTMGVAEELALMACGNNHPKTPDINTICQMFLSSAGALVTQWSESEKLYIAEFNVMKAPLWDGYAFDILNFKFNQKSERFFINDKHGNSYTPDHRHWQTALNHLVYQYTITIPMASHNWVHFSYPDSFAAAVFKRLSRDSVLFKLLYPHTRFTNRINYQAVYVQKSTDNTPSFKNKITPWKAFPVYGNEFRQGVLENTSNHYDDIQQHFDYPNTMDTNIPYFDFLKRYYDVVEAFVEKVAPFIEESDYEAVNNYIEQTLPGFSKHNMVQAISILIWQVSIFHTTEHMSYYNFAKEYGFTELKRPITEDFHINDVSEFNRFKIRCFLNVFGRFNKSKYLDQRLENYHAYHFESGSELEKFAIEFVSKLQMIDSELKKENNQILELNKIVQSVCF
ncbi:MAG: hypothetical protein HWE27_00670 [Gammaproteobacteria bacterium]|nr:hypothetical protein [Gammaproteobacteria bacterium]